jgi:hypothetical protein
VRSALDRVRGRFRALATTSASSSSACGAANAIKTTASAGKTNRSLDVLVRPPGSAPLFTRNKYVATTEVTHSGLNALLTPEESVLVLVDHQAFQFSNPHSHDLQLVVNNVVALAKTARLFGVPTILTTVLEERGGYIIKGIQDVFPDQKPINRTFINAWQDRRFVEAVKKTGARSWLSRRCGRKSVWQCRRFKRRERATTCSRLPTRQAGCLWKRTRWAWSG